jgi:lipase chaperone LimK
MRAFVYAAALGIGALLAYHLWSTATLTPSVAQGPVPAPAGTLSASAMGTKPAVQAQLGHRPAGTTFASEGVASWLSRTSLAGTQADGDWGVDAQGQLRASRALRQRFDYFLSLIGELNVSELRALVQREALSSLTPTTTAQVMAMWDRYVQLQQHHWRTQVDLRAPQSWSAALAERQQVRRELLGPDWAYAFYADEERQLQEMLTGLNANGQIGSANGMPAHRPQASLTHESGQTQAIHPQAAEREAQWQAQWQQWQQRLDAARAQVQALQAAPELSAPQRQLAIEHYLQAQFAGSDLTRARALLGL